MKTLLNTLRAGGEVRIGKYTVFGYGDGTMSIRHDGSGLMGPIARVTQAAWKRMLAWIDSAEMEQGR